MNGIHGNLTKDKHAALVHDGGMVISRCWSLARGKRPVQCNAHYTRYE